MKRFNLLTLLMLVLVLVLSVSVVQADNLAQETIKVRVTVPVMQKMKVINPISINLAELQAGLESGQAVIIRNAGMIRVMSNTDWVLQVSNSLYSSVNVYLRESNNPGAQWKLVSSAGSYFSGKQGAVNLSFDMKVEPTGVNSNYSDLFSGSSQVPFSFTLTG